jgi:polyphosphate glucokinase
MYVGGGNAQRLDIDLGPRAEVIANTAGLTGGIRLWDRYDGPLSRRPMQSGVAGLDPVPRTV